jgi:hypothetical protein
MRPIALLGQPGQNAGTDAKLDWIMQTLQTIARASQQEDLAIADTFTITNPVPQHSLNVSTATLADVTKVLGTLLGDMKKRGVNSGSG